MIDLQREHVGFVDEARGIAHVGVAVLVVTDRRPLTVWVGHAFRMLAPTVLTAGCVRGIIAPVNSPPVAIDPVPVAGHCAGGATSTPGLNRRTGSATDVVREKSPLRWRAVARYAAVRALSTIDTLRWSPRRTCDF